MITEKKPAPEAPAEAHVRHIPMSAAFSVCPECGGKLLVDGVEIWCIKCDWRD